MKKIALLLAAVLLLGCVLTACGKKEEKAASQPSEAEEKPVGMVNPMVETDATGFLAQCGTELNVPQGAADVKYFVINQTIGQMTFQLDGVDCTARIKPAAEFEDISGMYCTWDAEEDCTICGFDGRQMRGKTDGSAVDVCLWYDVVPGLMYSLTAQAKDLSGFDPTAVAEQVYKPMQGNVG